MTGPESLAEARPGAGLVAALASSGAAGAAAASGLGGCTVSALPRGQLKSSARPLGAAIGSPLIKTREAVASTAEGFARPPPPSNSSAVAFKAVSDTTDSV